MKLKLIILMIIIIVSSLSIVVASDLTKDISFDDDTGDDADSFIPEHHAFRNSHKYQDKDIVKNDFTIDGYLLKIIQ